VDPRQERIGKNEALFREVNDRISELSESGSAEFLCECGNRDCSAPIRLALVDYEAVRADPTLFIVIPGHEVVDVEVVIEQRVHYRVVKKHEGEPAELATSLDPRY
jgi:hypothetical protein